MRACVQLCPALCNPVDCSTPGSYVHGVFQAGVLQWVTISSSGGSSILGIETMSPVSPRLASRFFTTEPPEKPPKWYGSENVSCSVNPTLCYPMDYSPAGSSVHRILQVKRLEWVAMPFSRGYSDPGIEPGYLELQADSLPFEPPGKP